MSERTTKANVSDEPEWFVRSRLRAAAMLGMAGCALAFLVWAHLPTSPIPTVGGRMMDLSPRVGLHTFVLGVIWAVTGIAGVVWWRRARHRIAISAEGFLDLASYPNLIQWTSIADLDWATTNEGERLYLRLTGSARSGEVWVDLDQVAGGGAAVYDAALRRWLAATRGNAEEGSSEGTPIESSAPIP